MRVCHLLDILQNLTHMILNYPYGREFAALTPLKERA
ncbi:hypothetical protein AEAC466_06735 [Asticcacaulis sp. AC466]|nr:hypothetical protein AEAC466_06735 [Asticcacaulis sp. AC466]